MARTLHNAKLETRTARARLKPGKRHWWRFDNGAHLGYRRGPDPQIAGRWLLRLYNGKGTQAYTVETLPGRADDIDDADNMVTLSFDQATAKVRERLARSLRTAA